MNTYEIFFLKISQKNGIHIIELYINYQYTKCQTNIFISGCAMAQKPGKGDDVTSLNRIFSQSWPLTQFVLGDFADEGDSVPFRDAMCH